MERNASACASVGADVRRAEAFVCRPWLRLLLVLFSLAALDGAAQTPAPLPPPDNRPLQVREGAVVSGRGYVTSDRCQSCHLDQYASWHSSYHRTMSQVVSADTVTGEFEGVELGPADDPYRLERRGGEFWVELPRGVAGNAPDRRAAAQANPQGGAPSAAGSGRWRRIVQSTGSHHYQLYWYSTGAGRELNMLPFVFLREERRWVPRDSVFLQPPDYVTEKIVWNYQCLPCHSTDGQPGYLPTEPVARGGKSPDTRVAEMGIACEMCHGPGEKHVALYDAGGPPAGSVATAIAHPGKLSAARSAEVCGQCHSVNVPYRFEDWIDYLLDGPAFRPGEELGKSRYVVEPQSVGDSPLMKQWLDSQEKSLGDWFWPDGVVRVTGREYNGVRQSPCFAGGEFSCLSCHSPHASDPDDQLKPGMRGDQACLQCHEDLGTRLEAHTHHAADSAGSRCQNCHIPHTTYGLLKAVRSHTVSSPSIQETLQVRRPNACNLCHLDQTLAWTGRYLSEWYGRPAVAVEGEQAEVAAGPLGLLTGDAGLRALYAWHMGWAEARQASGEDWIAPVLAQTLNDPYDVVRYISGRSLRALPGFAAFDYDFVSPPEDRSKAAAEAIRIWSERRGRGVARGNSRVLIDADGAFDSDSARRLLDRRDDRAVLLAE
jgi:predicted CXXCH cytochrome family protein